MNLISTYNIVFDSINNNLPTDIILFDFSNAFDKIDYNLLFLKLQKFSLHPQLYNILLEFLTNRSQFVIINGCYSDVIPVTSGVPQGTILAPLLFSVYINDLFELNFSSHIRGFADDVKLLGTPGYNLQCDVTLLENWSKSNLMDVNIAKWAVIHFYACKKSYDYNFDGKVIPVQREAKDLGVIVDCDLSFKTHCLSVQKKSYMLVNLMFRNFKSKDPVLFVKLFNLYIYPVILYGFSFYGASSLNTINEIEKILKYFSRRLWLRLYPHKNIPSYQARLKHFNMNPLERCRARSDLHLVFKVVGGICCIPSMSIKFSPKCDYRIVINRIKTKGVKCFFVHRTFML